MRIQKVAVVGHPIGHTMSPFIHKRLFALSSIPMEYQAMDVPDLPGALPQLRTLDCFNITIPHKSAIIPFLDDLDQHARLCGSVNTVRVREGKLYGYTTDGPGAAVSLAIAGLDLHTDAVLLGNGGAAKAIAFEIAQQKDFQLTIVHRPCLDSYEKAMGLADRLAQFARGRGDKGFLVRVMSYPELEADEGGHYKLLVNTTSVGMYPNAGVSPVSEKVVARCGAVFDAVFNPGETKLLHLARKQGIKAVTGMGMLVCQAAYSHRIWYDTEFDPADLQRLIIDAQKELPRLFGGDEK